MPRNPERKLAPHVQAAIAGAMQPMKAGGGPRPPAAHVQAAMTGAMQPKAQGALGGGRPVAEHVRRAVAAPAQAIMQPSAAPEPAAHAQLSVASAAQPKPRAKPSTKASTFQPLPATRPIIPDSPCPSITACQTPDKTARYSGVAQRAERPDYGEVLGLDRFTNKPGVVASLPEDKPAEQTRFYNTSSGRYSDMKVKILNKSKLVVGEDIGKKTFAKAKASDGLLIVTGHGNIQWMFGNDPGHEEEAMVGFVEWLQNIENGLGFPLSTVVLDSCYSAVELKSPIEDVPNDSTARILSRMLGAAYRVVGFNGTASDAYIRHMSEGGNVKSDYGSNAVVFVNGDVVKGSIHPDLGKGILHETTNINTDHEFYDLAFPEGKPKLYRSDSFSNI